MSDRELILIVMRQNLMIAGMIADIGMSNAKANGNEALFEDIKLQAMKVHKITNEAIEGLKEK